MLKNLNLVLPYNTIFPFLQRSEMERIRTNKLFTYLSVMQYLLRAIGLSNMLSENLNRLLEHMPRLATIEDMGFPKDWEPFSVWCK